MTEIEARLAGGPLNRQVQMLPFSASVHTLVLGRDVPAELRVPVDSGDEAVYRFTVGVAYTPGRFAAGDDAACDWLVYTFERMASTPKRTCRYCGRDVILGKRGWRLPGNSQADYLCATAPLGYHGTDKLGKLGRLIRGQVRSSG